MADLDANNDGALEAAELEKCPGLKASLSTIDADRNGKLTQSEIAGRVKTYGASQVALFPFKCQVLLDGRPLRDAKVTLVPEKFLGDAIPSAGGTTNREGYAVLSVQELGQKGLAGVRCGIYRVQVSQPAPDGKERLPARYNAETTLGQEVAPDVRELEHGVTFRLTSR
jgi:hypothetical protein